MEQTLHNLLMLTEASRGLLDLAKLYVDRELFKKDNIGNKHPVLVIPGYQCSDDYTKMFRNFLTRQGFTVYGWGQGANLAKIFQYNKLSRLVKELAAKHQKPIKVIGYSLGGLYARKLSFDKTEHLDSVVTVGTPIYQDFDTASIKALKLYAKLSGADHKIQNFFDCVNEEPKVPTTVLYSKTDGIVYYENAVDKQTSPNLKQICIKGSHIGMMHNPMTWRAIRQLYHTGF